MSEPSELPVPSAPPELPVLDAAQQRVLGCLLEKEVTVPAGYPMTVGAVRTGCNQTSSREPVVDYDERLVHETLRCLKQLDLVGVTWQDSGRRTMKYVHRLDAGLSGRPVPPAQRALLSVLLLRGPQAPGALKTRTERLHAFADRSEVEVLLAEMAAAEPPLARRLERQPGQQDHRWVHLLGPVDDAASSPPPVEDHDGQQDAVVLRDGPQARDERVRAAYDAIAPAYAETLADELAGLAFERWLLDRVAGLAGDLPVVEVGCGPGHVTAHLAGLGVEATGIDLSPVMVALARERFPAAAYDVGDLRHLMRPTTAAGWGAVLAWYSLIHLAASELPAALDALVRPLAPGGVLVLALHAGTRVEHADEWFDQPVSLDFTRQEPAQVVALVTAAGLVDVEWYRRGPVAARQEQSERLYVLARKPA